MGSQNSLHHIEGQPQSFNGKPGSGLHLPPGALEQFEQYQMYQRNLTPEQAAQLAAAQRQQPQGSGPPGARVRTTGPPGARGQPMSDTSSGTGAASGNTGSNNMNLTEQNMMKLIGNLDLKAGGSYNESSNSGSDITLRLFDRLRAQQKIQKEQKEKERLQQQMQQQQQIQQQPANNNQQIIQNLFQNMQSMTPAQQQEYFQQLIQQQQHYQFPIHSTDIQNSLAAIGQSGNPVAEQFIQLLRQYEQQNEQQQFNQQQEESDIVMDADEPQIVQQQQNLLNKVEHIFEWSFGGENVEICSEFNTWQGEKMDRVVPGEPIKGTGLTQKATQAKIGQQPPTHYFVKFLDAKRYEYKFRVDGNWRYAPDQQITRDERGNENNVIDLTNAKTVLQLLQEKQQQSTQPSVQQQPNQFQQQQFLLQQLQQQLMQLPQSQSQQVITPNYLLEQQNMLTQTQQALSLLQQQQNFQNLDPAQQQQLLILQQHQALKTQQLQQNIQQMQQQQQMMAEQMQQQQIQQQQIQQQQQVIVQKPSAAQSQGSSQNKAEAEKSQNSNPSKTGAGQGSSTRGEPEQGQDNIYHQNLPDDAEEPVQDPQVLPIHFNYNFIERDKIPLHNEKFSKINDDHQKQTDLIKKGFFDNTLPIPSHVVLNHINSWETMSSLQGSPRGENETSNGGLTCVSMAQRLNRSKFLTIVYYKPTNNKY